MGQPPRRRALPAGRPSAGNACQVFSVNSARDLLGRPLEEPLLIVAIPLGRVGIIAGAVGQFVESAGGRRIAAASEPAARDACGASGHGVRDTVKSQLRNKPVPPGRRQISRLQRRRRLGARLE